MYGLCQAEILGYDHLRTCLAPHRYSLVVGTVGVWKYETHPTRFCVCVDDFGIKYFNKDDADHLLQSTGKNYQYTTDRKGNNYCGLTLNWNYPD